MRPADVRQRVLSDHGALRERLERLETAALLAGSGDPEVLTDLRAEGRSLHAFLFRHLDLEDRYLVPILRECRGEEAAEALTAEHREQRLLFSYVLGRLQDGDRPTRLIGGEICTFIALLRDDMQHEESSVLEAEDVFDGNGALEA